MSTHTGTLIVDLQARSYAVLVNAIEQAQVALCIGDSKTGAMTPEATQAFLELGDLKEKIINAAQSKDLGQCWYETVESRAGACDGGLRCTSRATREVNGMAFCELHGLEEQTAQEDAVLRIVRELTELNKELHPSREN